MFFFPKFCFLAVRNLSTEVLLFVNKYEILLKLSRRIDFTKLFMLYFGVKYTFSREKQGI